MPLQVNLYLSDDKPPTLLSFPDELIPVIEIMAEQSGRTFNEEAQILLDTYINKALETPGALEEIQAAIERDANYERLEGVPAESLQWSRMVAQCQNMLAILRGGGR